MIRIQDAAGELTLSHTSFDSMMVRATAQRMSVPIKIGINGLEVAPIQNIIGDT